VRRSSKALLTRARRLPSRAAQRLDVVEERLVLERRSGRTTALAPRVARRCRSSSCCAASRSAFARYCSAANGTIVHVSDDVGQTGTPRSGRPCRRQVAPPADGAPAHSSGNSGERRRCGSRTVAGALRVVCLATRSISAGTLVPLLRSGVELSVGLSEKLPWSARRTLVQLDGRNSVERGVLDAFRHHRAGPSAATAYSDSSSARERSPARG